MIVVYVRVKDDQLGNKRSQGREGAGQGMWLSVANETIVGVRETVAHLSADGEEDRDSGVLTGAA